MINILSKITHCRYINLIGKEIKVEFVDETNVKHYVTGTCLNIPPPLIICDLYNDISPSLRVQSIIDHYTIYHIPMNKITNIYLTREDKQSKTYAVLLCQRKKICKDIERYILTFINGWTHDVEVC